MEVSPLPGVIPHNVVHYIDDTSSMLHRKKRMAYTIKGVLIHTRSHAALGQAETPVFFVTTLIGIFDSSVTKSKYPQSPPIMPFIKATDDALMKSR